jgi:Spy/CpxP family protein refolding chaperone
MRTNNAATAGEDDEPMTKSSFSIPIAIAILAICLGAGVARAQETMGPPGGGMMMGPAPGPFMITTGPIPPPLMMALRAANLSAAQQTQVHDILDSSRKSTMPLMQQMHSIHEQIADKLLSTGSVSAADFAPLLTQQSQLQQQLDNQMVSTGIQIRGVLTPDQLTKVSAANEKLKQIHSQIESILGPPDAPPAP